MLPAGGRKEQGLGPGIHLPVGIIKQDGPDLFGNVVATGFSGLHDPLVAPAFG